MSANSSTGDHYTALIVGAGWSGIWMLQSLRNAGMTNCKIVDANQSIGGTWHYTRYPGCRNDVPVPEYQFSEECTWKDFSWDHRYPFQPEMQQYFLQVCEKLDLTKHMIFGRRVTSASWADRQCQWIIKLDDCEFVTAKYFILSTGYTSKANIPEVPGIEKFPHKYHTSSYPPDLDLNGKRVGVIGTGASGLQCIEGIHDTVKELVVYHRTPNLATARRIGHDLYNKKQEAVEKQRWPEVFAHCGRTSSGQTTEWEDFDLNDTKRKNEMLEQKWKEGNLWFGNHRALLNDEQFNMEVYNFWRQKVHERVRDPRKREILAPVDPPHPFGAKRPSHESSYFETYNQDNVTLVDLKTDPFIQVDESGITCRQSGHQDLDIIVLATGFDAIVGSILNNISIRGRKGADLYTKWNTRIRTNYGCSVADFPNFFFLAGPQAPTVFGTTPRLAEIQGAFIASVIANAGLNGVVDPDEETEKEWDRECERVCPKLMWKSKTWYMRFSNFGKGPVQPACWYGGMSEYKDRLRKCRENGYKGFHFSRDIKSQHGEENGSFDALASGRGNGDSSGTFTTDSTNGATNGVHHNGLNVGG